MKYVILFLTAVLFVTNATADGLKVSTFSVSLQDLSARTEPRLDNRGKNCALIKVQCPIDRLSFGGNVRGDAKYENSVYWIYMDCNSEFLLINMSKGDPLLVTFGEYLQADTLESNTTYNLQVVVQKYDFSKHYVPTNNGEVNGHQFVDLGLSVYWATCNIGANKPNEKGERFAWGEISSRTTFTLENYKFYSGYGDSDEYYTNYMEDSTLKPSDDAATVKWGGKWRIPNKEDLIELYNNCTFYWTNYNGVSGYVVTGPNGNSIFLPYVETEEEEEIREKTFGHDIYGDEYMKLAVIQKTKVAKYSSSYSSDFAYCSYGTAVLALRFTDQGIPEYKNSIDYPSWESEVNIGLVNRHDGLSVRPVLPK